MAKTFQEFLNEQFKPFIFKNFEVTEARSWDPNKFISHHANVRSKERFPNFNTNIWQGLIKFAINKFGDEFVKMKDPDSPSGYVGYRSFALKFNHDGYEGWMTLRVRRHPDNRELKRYNLMAITVLGPDQPPLKKHNDVIRSLPPTKTPAKVMSEAFVIEEVQMTEELNVPNQNKSPSKRRYTLPQIESKDLKDFFSWAKENYNIKTDLSKLDPKKLIPLQNEFDENKVNVLESSGNWRNLPIVVSGDGYVIDGHHRWLAASNLDSKIDAYVVKGNVAEVINIMKNYPKSFKKKLYEDTYSSFISEMKNNPCWKNYEMVGTKKKNGKEVPNCVPKMNRLHPIQLQEE